MVVNNLPALTNNTSMIHKLFGGKPIEKDLLGTENWSPPPVDIRQIRVLLCQKVGEDSKTALFDTNYSLTTTAHGSVSSSSSLSSSWTGGSFSAFANKASEVFGSFTDRGDRRASIADTRDSGVRTLPAPELTERRKANGRLDFLGDMIFGTTPLAYKGMNTKIHYIKNDQPQLLFTKVFFINPRDLDVSSPGRRRGSVSSATSDMSMSSSLTSSMITPSVTSSPVDIRSNGLRTIPIHVPTGGARSRPSSMAFGDDSSDEEASHNVRIPLSPTFSSMQPPIIGLKHNDGLAFANRRIRRASQTSMENGLFNPTPLPNGTTRSTGDMNSPLKSRSISYAIAVVITLSNNNTFQEFLFSHYALLENKMHQLQAVAFDLLCEYFRNNSRAQISGPDSIFTNPSNTSQRARTQALALQPYTLQNEGTLLEAVFKFREAVCILYSTPRLQEPLWLNMITYPTHQAKYAHSLVTELVYLIDNYDTKKSNFFVSALLTTVLMYHLSWVPTVAPEDESELWGNGGKQNALVYDPLWAQLSELYGNIVTPSRVCRTIIVGRQPNVVRRILFILSYFIRCNEVLEHTEDLDASESNFFFGAVHDVKEDRIEEQIVRTLTSFSHKEGISIPKKKPDVRIAGSPSSLHTDPIYSRRQSTQSIFPGDLNRRDSLNGWSRNGEYAEPNGRPVHPMERSNSKSLKSPTNQIFQNGVNSKPNANVNDTNGSAIERPILSSSPTSMTSETFGSDSKPCTKNQNATHKLGATIRPAAVPATTLAQHSEAFANQHIDLEYCLVVPMPKSSNLQEIPETNTPLERADKLFTKSYGRSLMAGFCESYRPDFALIGLSNMQFLDHLESDLKDSLKQYALAEPISQSICIVADTDAWQCQVRQRMTDQSGGSRETQVIRSQVSEYVRNMLMEIRNKFTTTNDAVNCVNHLENRLQELYMKSKQLQAYAHMQVFDRSAIAKEIGVDGSDLLILLNICMTYDSRIHEKFKNFI